MEVIVRIALAQIITGRDLAGNLDLVADYAARAKAGGAELVVFPEATMRAFGNSLLDIAERSRLRFEDIRRAATVLHEHELLRTLDAHTAVTR